MRLLVGPLYGSSQVTDAFAATRAFDARFYGRSGAPIVYDPATEPLGAVFERLPPGWWPDALIWSGPEYTVIPDGVETCPVPTVALCGDWSVNSWATLPLLPAFDMVFTDRGGVAALSRLGLRHAHHWRSYTFDPAVHHAFPGVEPDIDLLFVGNPNVAMYPDRERWLCRVARLASRHRVLIASGLSREAYGRALARARIVFNRSMRGEMNQRAYEVPAVGALLFMERENLEVRELFEDRVHCVLYGEDDFEALVEHYLAHEDERRAVARAGHERVWQAGADHHVRELAERLAAALPPVPPVRPFAQTSESRRALQRALKALFCVAPDMGGGPAALAFLSRVRDPALDGPLWGTLGSALAMTASAAAPAQRADLLARARAASERAAARDPTNALHRLRMGELAARAGEWPLAVESLRAAADLAAAPAGTASPPDSLPYPFEYDRFRFLWDRAATEGPAVFVLTAQRLVRARALHRLAECLARLGQSGAAGEAIAASVEAWPSLSGNSLALGQWLEAQGRDGEALGVYRDHLSRHPMDGSARLRMGEVVLRAGTAEDVRAFRRDTEDLHRAMQGAP